MLGMGKSAAAREYTIAVAAWMSLYAVLILLVSWAEDAGRLSGAIVYPAALAPSVPIVGVMWAVLRFLNRSDEFVRALLAKRLVIAVAILLCACVIYGFLETYAGAYQPPLWIVFPGFWIAFGLVSPFVRSSR